MNEAFVYVLLEHSDCGIICHNKMIILVNFVQLIYGQPLSRVSIFFLLSILDLVFDCNWKMTSRNPPKISNTGRVLIEHKLKISIFNDLKGIILTR